MPNGALSRSALGLAGVSLTLWLIAACEPGTQRSDTAATRPSPPAALALVAESPWCKEHGCELQDTWPLAAGGSNYLLRVRDDDHATVEAQILNDTLVGASIVLYGGAGRAAGERTEVLLVAFVRDVAGPCEAGAQQVKRRYATAVSGVMEAPAVRCGRWAIRAGKVVADFHVSIDKW